MVLQQRSLGFPETLGDILPLFRGEHDAVVVLVHHMVVVECTCVLCKGVQLPAQCTECAAVDTVTVCSGVDVGSRLVDLAVDHERGFVEEPVLAAVEDVALLVDQNEVGFVDQAEGVAEWVHPEAVRVYRVAHCNVTCYSFVESVFAEDAEGGGEAAFEVVALFVRVVELGWALLCQQT